MLANQYIAKAVSIFDQLDLEGERIPFLIMGRPGSGKTATIKKYCDFKDYNLFTLIASRYNSDDILGLQTVKNDELIRLTPSWYNRLLSIAKNGKRTLLFLDEITTVNEFIQGPLLDFISNRSLGEKVLPDNVFIVAAGNYSDDLNNAFKMTAPLVNRFMILNLRSSDYNVPEFVREFSKRNFEKEKVTEEFLGLLPKKSKYSFEAFMKWVENQGEIFFGGHYSEDEENGLLGFTSLRSLYFVFLFTQKYLETFDDDLWIRIVGDTLGMSEKRKDRTLSSIMFASRKCFLEEIEGFEKVTEVCDRILQKGINQKDLEFLSSYVESVTPSTITSAELSKLISVIKKYSSIRALSDIQRTLEERLHQ